MIDLICSQTGKVVGSMDIDLPRGQYRTIQFPIESPDGRGFSRLEFPVVRVADADGIERQLLRVDPGVLPTLQRMPDFRPPLASH